MQEQINKFVFSLRSKIKKYSGVLVVVIAAVLIGVVFYKFSSGVSTLSAEEASQQALVFINNVLLAGQDEAEIVGDLGEKSGLYTMTVSVMGQETALYITKDGKLLIPAPNAMQITTSTPAQEISKTLGNFSVTEEEVCLEEGKPLLYFFGADTCPHCLWEHPIFDRVVAKFGNVVVNKDNMNDIVDQDVFRTYNSQGSIPTIVLGCKYYRIGTVGENAENGDLTEERNLTALICKLTDNQPSDVCASVADLVNQIQ